LTTDEQKDRILSDRFLRLVYTSLYSELLSCLNLRSDDTVVEIGSGAGILRDVTDHRLVFMTDLAPGPGVSVIADARDLPFRTSSIRGLVLKDSLHHIPDVEAFLHEAERVLQNGGHIAIIDPYWGPISRFVYRQFHPEPFEPHAPTWEFASRGPNDSNQALLWILLRRDRSTFEKMFPSLKVKEMGPRVGPSFLLSGGLHGRSIVPGRFLAMLYAWESKRGRWFDYFRFFFLVNIEKVN
jgi:SAM-dependent methyltransferase